ncbi:MAG TPA: CBS domain-containing protein [Acidobacteriota bacterium]|nr:CBS domain-containing protein [Acidobacteriota bacterium]
MRTVKDVLREQMRTEIYSVMPNQSVLSAAQFMESKNLGAVPVIDDGEVVGIVSERDMLRKVLGPGLDPRDVTVSKIMTHDFLATSPDENVQDCLLKMRKVHCRHLPVIQKGKLIGTISLRDILGMTEAEFLEHYLWNIEGRKEYSSISG